MFRIKQIIILLLLFSISLKVSAADVSYFAGVSIGHYDNLNLENEPVDDDFSTSYLAGITVAEDNVNLFANIIATGESISYKNETAADENLGSLLAEINWRIKPGQFEWVLTDSFTQTAIDTLASDTPTNRQNVNVFSTGPNYIVRINSRNNLQFEARAENYSFEENTDNNRLFLAGRWSHDVNSSLTITLNNEAESTRFEDDIVNTDFERNDVFLELNYANGLNTVDAEYGFTHVSNENIQDIDESRYLFSMTNARTRTSSIRLAYENILSDTGSEVLDLTSGSSGTDTSVGSAANDIFVDESFILQYFKNVSSGNTVFEINTTKREYKRQTNLDEKETMALISGTWNLQRADNLLYNIEYINTQFLDPSFDREDDDKIYSITYFHRIKRNVNINFEVTSQERISSIQNESYEDLRMILSLNYTSL